MFTERGQITEFYLVNVSTVWVESIHNICIPIRMICAKPINISYFFFNLHFPPSSEISLLAISLSLKVQYVAKVLSAFEVMWWADGLVWCSHVITYCDILDTYIQMWTLELKVPSNGNPFKGIDRSLLSHLKSTIFVLHWLIYCA